MHMYGTTCLSHDSNDRRLAPDPTPYLLTSFYKNLTVGGQKFQVGREGRRRGGGEKSSQKKPNPFRLLHVLKSGIQVGRPNAIGRCLVGKGNKSGGREVVADLYIYTWPTTASKFEVLGIFLLEGSGDGFAKRVKQTVAAILFSPAIMLPPIRIYFQERQTKILAGA